MSYSSPLYHSIMMVTFWVMLFVVIYGVRKLWTYLNRNWH